MGVNGGIGKMGKAVFWLPIPQNQTKSGNIQPRLTSRHSLQEKRHRYPTHPPLLQKTKWGLIDVIEWESMQAFLGTFQKYGFLQWQELPIDSDWLKHVMGPLLI